ncbi:MAG: argininosuccinate lyase [Chitinispirillaceae bacterium]|nr:argininosuccinate lyase [Chitinispirillaceae bacterium]
MKMWDGRFTKPSDSLMERFQNSLFFDQALIDEDIAGSIAWAGALERIGIFTRKESETVQAALAAIGKDYHRRKVTFSPHDEDIHMAIERLLSERVGDAGARLHTGRSRNDQAATDLRLFVRKRLIDLQNEVTELQRALVARAETDGDVIMPGFTHLQQAQPILLAHYWLSFFFLLERDKGRITNAVVAADMLPLGSGAIAGSGFDIDRVRLAETLGFTNVSDNSIDAVASRDYVLEALAACASLGIGMSRYAEDLIIFSSHEFGFVEVDDAWSTGSSMMPQKKNPDSLELIRGKCGRFIGNYARMAATLKGVGLAYYKDLQEDKEPLFDSVAQMEMALQVFTRVIATLSIRKERITTDLHPFLLATDLADYLVRKGMPFRQAHQTTGRIVGHCIERNIALTSLTVDELRGFSDLFSDDAMKLFSWEGAIAGRNVRGGTGRTSVKAQIRRAKKLIRTGQ